MNRPIATTTQDAIDRQERRRANLILAYRNIGVHIDEDTPLSAIPPINQVTKLKMLATKHRRPVSHLDLTDRALVARELDRLMMLEGGTRRRGTYKRIAVDSVKGRKLDTAKRSLTPAQMRKRALEAKTVRDGRTASGRFSETYGYGSNASHTLQVAEARAMGAETLTREATEAQLDYIRTLATRKRIDVGTLPTRFDLAQELIDELTAAQARPTKAMAKYLSDLQARLGLEQKPANSFDACKAELDRLIAIRDAR